MLPLIFRRDKDKPLRILCLGSHPDDIEIGCGATILELLADYSKTHVMWVVLSGNPVRADEARQSAAHFLEKATECEVVLRSFMDGYFPDAHGLIKEFFESEIKVFEPDVIFTHYRADRHQDHKVTSDLTWNTFRNHLILEYEIPKYDADLAQPNFFVEVSEKNGREKISTIVDIFKSQREKQWFTEETFWALLRLRGVECAAQSKFAEAFHAHKLSLSTVRS